jgi:hypothetical protein
MYICNQEGNAKLPHIHRTQKKEEEKKKEEKKKK